MRAESLGPPCLSLPLGAEHGLRGQTPGMNIEFVSTIAVITPDPPASRRLYVDTLGLPLTSETGGDYLHSAAVAGTRHFGIWPLSEAAAACFGTDTWPENVPIPQVSIEFDVTDPAAVAAAADELPAAGYEPLHPAREEPWGQTVARLLSPEGAIVGISHIPAMHAGTLDEGRG